MVVLAVLACLLQLHATGQSNKRYDSKDEQALQDMVVKWERYWNIHNMDSMGTLLRADVDFLRRCWCCASVLCASYTNSRIYHSLVAGDA
jgi:hypothetical protein